MSDFAELESGSVIAGQTWDVSTGQSSTSESLRPERNGAVRVCGTSQKMFVCLTKGKKCNYNETGYVVASPKGMCRACQEVISQMP